MRSVQDIHTSYRRENKQIDFYATVNEDQTPHITIINSLHILNEQQFVWGESSGGLSKKNQRERHQVGFLSLINDDRFVWGKGDWLEGKSSGEEINMLNEIPELKYDVVNRYMPAHIIGKKEMTESALSHKQIQKAKDATKAVATQAGKGNNAEAISQCTEQYVSAENGFKVLAFIDEDGYPQVVPVPQAMIADANRIVFTLETYQKEVNNLRDGMEVSILAVEFPSLCSVLLHGTLQIKDIEKTTCGILDVDRVYNSMLPVIGYVYPPQPIEPVVEFENVLYEYNV